MGRATIRFHRAVSGLAVTAALVLAAPSGVLAQEAAPQPVPVTTGEASGLPEWDIAVSEFPADPDITFGRLPNGMRYALSLDNEVPTSPAFNLTLLQTLEVPVREAKAYDLNERTGRLDLRRGGG